MPCDTQISQEQTEKERQSEIDAALAELERKLASSAVRIEISADGAICFAGWDAASRKRVSDVCAYRTLIQRGSWELRQAVARAETLTGKRVNPATVASGMHSHDGGRSWGKD